MKETLIRTVYNLSKVFFEDEDDELKKVHIKNAIEAYTIELEDYMHTLIKHAEEDHLIKYHRDPQAFMEEDVDKISSGDVMNACGVTKSQTVWKHGWRAWNNRVDCLVTIQKEIPYSQFYRLTIPTAEQLAGEIGGVKVIAYSKNDNTESKIIEFVYENGYNQSYYHETYDIGIAICEKFNIPILSWEQIEAQYGGQVPQLESSK